MPTTDAALAAVALDALAEAGVPFVVLHGEAEIASGKVTTDVDIAVGWPPDRTVRAIAPALRAAHVHLIVVWSYDPGVLTTFWCDATGERGVELDMLFDPSGRNRYGLRSVPLVSACETGARWPRPDPLDELVYLLRKRQVKGQADRFEALLARARDIGMEVVLARAEEALEPAAFRLLCMAMTSGHAVPESVRRFRHPLHYVQRLRRSAGFWAHLGGVEGSTAWEVARRLGAVLAGASVLDLSCRPVALWCRAVAGPSALRTIMLGRLRPWVVLSTGCLPRWPHPDLVIEETASVDELCAHVVAAMERRFGEIGT